MFKRFQTVLLSLTLMLFLMGCSHQPDPSLDTTEAAVKILSTVRFDEQLELIDSDMAKKIIGAGEEINCRMYIASRACADTLIILEAVSNDVNAKDLEVLLSTYAQAQDDAFRNYLPEETEKTENYVLKCRGKYGILCITADYASAGEVISSML